jgi:hypothetical protein
MAQVLREQRMNYDIALWSQGVDRHTTPAAATWHGAAALALPMKWS